MAGEVKYDTLPFIDSSGKDTFETGEEPKVVTKNVTLIERGGSHSITPTTLHYV